MRVSPDIAADRCLPKCPLKVFLFTFNTFNTPINQIMKRRPFITSFLVGLMVSLMLSACTTLSEKITGESLARQVTITVSAASSLQEALEAITAKFSAAYPHIVAEYNFSASGVLQQQIEQGAPVDVFFSAAVKQMDSLAEKDLIVADSRQDLVTNSLVLIAPVTTQLELTHLAQLEHTKFSRFAVGEFRSVPAGQYAQQVFKKLNLLAPLQSKFVFGNNVRNILTAVESGNAELGMVYATDAALSEKVNVLATVPEEAHSPIVYPIAVLKNAANAEPAQTFIDFLTTEPAQATFEAFGFGRL